jgi:hypothetical protein
VVDDQRPRSSAPDSDARAGKPRFRAHARKPVRLAAVVAHRERGWQRDVIVFDLGLGGACVEASDALGVGDRVQVSFVTADRWDPLQLTARVAWTSDARAGLAFEYPSPESTWGVFELLLGK